MMWKKLTIKTTTEAEDILIASLYEVGLQGAQIEDNVPLTALEKEQMFVDILLPVQDDDGVAYLHFFVEEDPQTGMLVSEEFGEITIDELISRIDQKLDEVREFIDIGDGDITLSSTEDKDWINNWKEFFHQFHVDDLLIVPSWEEVKEEDQNKKVLHIDPGTAFGTGMHETTQLCIRQIKQYVSSETNLLDVGTGSGILSIVALMYGAKSALGTDLDPCAEGAVAENMEANHISQDKFTMFIGNIITEHSALEKVGFEKYEMVVANILAEVLVELTPVVYKCLKPGGVYITSGIIDDKEETVVRAIEKAGLEVLEVNYQGEWVIVTAQKPAK